MTSAGNATAPVPRTLIATEYVVLRENIASKDTVSPNAGTHSIVTTVKARSAADAIRQAAGKTEGTYRAVPARSFQPVKVTVETTTTIKLD